MAATKSKEMEITSSNIQFDKKFNIDHFKKHEIYECLLRLIKSLAKECLY